MVTKKQLAKSVAKFIANDLVTDIDDSQVKMVLCVFRRSMLDNPDMLDTFLENDMLSSMIKEQDGMYDIDGLATVLKNVISEYQTYPVTIPSVPLLLSEDRKIKITGDDVDKIMTYIHEFEEKPAE